jgi:N-ethylmaleimide reductase
MPAATTQTARTVATAESPAERLFQPVQLGPYTLPHRMAMAPLTRSRARHPGNVPTSLNA